MEELRIDLANGFGPCFRGALDGRDQIAVHGRITGETAPEVQAMCFDGAVCFASVESGKSLRSG